MVEGQCLMVDGRPPHGNHQPSTIDHRPSAPERLNAPSTGVRFFDSVGIALYAMDIHPAKGEPPFLMRPLPYYLPLGAFIPRSGPPNVLPAAKNFGATRLALSSARMHPTEWLAGAIGGRLAAVCLQERRIPTAAPRPHLTDPDHVPSGGRVSMAEWQEIATHLQAQRSLPPTPHPLSRQEEEERRSRWEAVRAKLGWDTQDTLTPEQEAQLDLL